MRKHFVALALVVGIAVLILLGCSGPSNVSLRNPTAPTSGSLTVFGTDAPLCSVVSFDVTIAGATLTPQGGGDPVSIIPSDPPVRVDFASLMGFATVLNFASVKAGTYSQITLTLAQPELTVMEGSTPTTIPTSLSSGTVTANITPTLEVTSNGSAGLMLDFRLLKSVEINASGQVTGTVNPIFRVHPTVITILNGLGELDELHGIVQSVTTSSTDLAFIGSFNLQIARNRTLVINVTERTRFRGVSDLSGLVVGTFVEVDAFVNQSGRIVAREVEVEERANENERRVAFVGLVIAREPATGPVTQFTLFVRREHPDVRDTIPLRSRLVVNITPDTRFGIAALGLDVGSRLFNPMTLGVGQHVVVHGRFELTDPPTLTAGAVYLRRQAILGNYQPPLLAVGSDGKTGGFTLIPCSPIFRTQPINVLTFNWTFFDGVSDLNGLTEGPLYITKGLLFYEQTPGMVNGVSWNPPPPVYVQAAGMVRELPVP